MINALWTIVAYIVSRKWLADRIISYAMRTPYTHITSATDGSLYMGRWWLFNPYPAPGSYRRKGWRDWLPSVRIHHIIKPDSDRHMHDHPWNARTIILRGWYVEYRPYGIASTLRIEHGVGDTATLKFNEYHRIERVADGGAWTMFWTWRYQGTWGFLVNGVKVPWREYLGMPK